MINKILNIGVLASQDDNLNRRMRISNMISLFTIVTMVAYIPVTILYNILGIAVLNLLFFISALICLFLNARGLFNASVFLSSAYGLFYFTFGSVFYGIQSNLHFFIIIMCLIAIALFKSNAALRLFIVLAVICFFSLVIFFGGKPGLIPFTEEMKRTQGIISIVNLFVLFVITVLFFVFFRRENLLFQKAIIGQKQVIEEKQKEIMDSINYAKRIQFALLASENLLNEFLPNRFIFFKPKDVVSGDFYWATPTPDGCFIYVTADCTGHGVPGAFMSLLNISKLSQCINENKITRPDWILNYIRTEIIKGLNAEGSSGESKDGMDAVLCKLNIAGLKLEYSAANNSFYIIRDNAILVCKADKMPVGIGHDDSLPFTYNQIALQPGDMIYTFTDGFADQFGGPKGKKFKYKQFEELLLSVHRLPLTEQSLILEEKFNSWKGAHEQVDDVLVIGIKV
ncbi:MAG: protein serine/threonine phosphatase [Bacteroidota bacterium]|jgi:serine phosphatase RsbU (regulator of sigma subunit)|nr:protein serine/threonine phosphatase [Bacteroidota bacterium]